MLEGLFGGFGGFFFFFFIFFFFFVKVVDPAQYLIGHVNAIYKFSLEISLSNRDPSWGGPIELFLLPASAPQLWDGAYKRTLAVNHKE